MLDFLKNSSTAFIIQWIIYAASVVILLTKIKLGFKYIIILISKICGVWLALTALQSFLYYIIFRNVTLSSSLGMAVLEAINLFACAVVLFVYSVIFRYYRTKTIIIFSAVFYVTAMVLHIFFNTVRFTLIFYLRIYDSSLLGNLLLIIVSSLLIAVVFYIKRRNFDELSMFPRNGFALIISLCVVTFIARLGYMAVLIMQPGDYSTIFAFIVFICLLIIILISYSMFYKIINEYNQNSELIVLRQAEKENAKMLHLYEKNHEDLRALRHDIINHNLYMRVLLDEKKYNELEEYFDTLNAQSLKVTSFIESNNQNINAIINIEMSKAESKNVKIDTKIAVPSALPFDNIDMCVILTNLIDNAIEACERYGLEAPTVYIQIFQRQDYLFIYVSNPVLNNEDSYQIKGFETHKADKRSHGFGMKIVEQTVKKYNGVVEYKIVDNVFYANAILDLNYDMKK